MSRCALVVAAALLWLCSPAAGAQDKQSDREKAAAINAELAITYMKQDNLRAAREKVDRALEQDPRSVQAQMAAGFVYDRLGEDKKAGAHFEQAVKLGGMDNPETLNNAAVFQCRKGNKKRGEELFLQAAASPLYRTPEVALANAGHCASADGRPKDAERYFRQALARRPTMPDSLLALAGIQHEAGNDMQARAFVQRTRIEPVINRAQDWFLLSMQSWSEVMRPSLPYRQLLVILLALGMIVPLLVTAYGVRHITNPIQKLIQASEQVTAGQFKHRIEVKTGDEIETLADQFNLMSAELDESYSSLEKKVAERTHELATLNAIGAHVSSLLNLSEIMADALERIMELTGMEHGIAYRIEGGEGGAANNGTDAEEAYLRVMAFRGLPPTLADLGDRLPLRQSAAGVAGRRGEPVIWTLAELPTESAVRERLAALGVEQIIAIPLMTKGRLVGSLNLSTNQQPDLSAGADCTLENDWAANWCCGGECPWRPSCWRCRSARCWPRC